MKKYFKILGFIGLATSVVVLLLYIPNVYAASEWEAQHKNFYNAFLVLSGLSEEPSRIMGAAISMLVAFIFHFVGFVFSIIQMRFIRLKSFSTNIITGISFLFAGIGQIVYFSLWIIDYSIPVVMSLIISVLFIALGCLNLVPIFISFFRNLDD